MLNCLYSLHVLFIPSGRSVHGTNIRENVRGLNFKKKKGLFQRGLGVRFLSPLWFLREPHKLPFFEEVDGGSSAKVIL